MPAGLRRSRRRPRRRRRIDVRPSAEPGPTGKVNVAMKSDPPVNAHPPTSPATPSVVARPLGLAPHDVPGLTDVLLDRKPSLTGFFSSLMGMLATLVLVIVLKETGLWPGWLLGTMWSGLTVQLGCTMVALWLGQVRARRKTRRLTQDSVYSDLARFVRQVENDTGWFGGVHGLREMTRILAQRGRLGAIIRLLPTAEVFPVTALNQPFEPMSLDESDPLFEYLSPMNSRRERLPGEPSPARPVPPDAMRRRLSRNVHLRGGWLPLGLGAVLLAGLVWESVEVGTITIDLAVFLLLALVLWAQLDGWTVISREQFLAAPGALIVRRAGLWRSNWRVHVFDRRRAVLTVYQIRKSIWELTVADAATQASVRGTKREMQFALGAWLSPLEPPSAEQLTDLR
jgi:hypothetical protein